MKISELSEDVLYILCPDESCELFFDSKTFQCIGRSEDHCCPFQTTARKLIICQFCHKPMILPVEFFSWCRVFCKKCQTEYVHRPLINCCKYRLVRGSDLKELDEDIS
jgi:hypothetical protein